MCTKTKNAKLTLCSSAHRSVRAVVAVHRRSRVLCNRESHGVVPAGMESTPLKETILTLTTTRTDPLRTLISEKNDLANQKAQVS